MELVDLVVIRNAGQSIEHELILIRDSSLRPSGISLEGRPAKHGGKSDGAPGLRPEYDVNYYGAFLYDPDGNKVEALTLAVK